MNLMHPDYLTVINDHQLGASAIAEAIETADLKLLSSILTGFIRQERFMEGFWRGALEDKIFLKILNRFQELIK